MVRGKFVTVVLAIIIFSSLASAVLISDQGTDVKDISTQERLEVGDLTIRIYDSPIGGNPLFDLTVQNAIVNGSWNLMINPDLEYGKYYWKDYEINGDDLDFNGNERIEFQSPLGLINDASFFNFSLIQSCAEGYAVRIVNEDGSVECIAVGGGEADLADYALKNQSEIFEGNITAAGTGFFEFLGSITSRITKLFVQDIDVSGNVTASYFIGDGSLLTGLPTSEVDLSDYYNKTDVDELLDSRMNLSWNQSLADTIYYPLSNPYGFINETTVYDDAWINQTFFNKLEILGFNYYNSSDFDIDDYLLESDWDLAKGDYYLATNPSGYYNSTNFPYTHLSNFTNDLVITPYDDSWINQTFYNQTQVIALLSQYYNQTEIDSILEEIELMFDNYYNQSEIDYFLSSIINSSFNQTLADSLYYPLNENPLNYLNESYDDSWINQTFYNQTQVIALLSQYYNQTEIDSILEEIELMFDNYYNITDIDSVLSSVINSSFNQSLTDSLYYPLNENPHNYFNETNLDLSGSSVNNSNHLDGRNTTDLFEYFLELFKDIFYTKDEVYNRSEIDNFILEIEPGNSSFNQSLTDTLYSSIIWGYNQTQSAIDYVNSQEFLTSYEETDPVAMAAISGNMSAWLSTYNSSYESLGIDGVIIKYQNITNIPTCAANEILTFDGATLSCVEDQIGEIGTYNASYHATSMDVSANRSSWFSTYNSTYDSKISYNSTFNQTLTDALYTYIAGSNLTLIGQTFSLNTVSLKSWLDLIYQPLGDYLTGVIIYQMIAGNKTELEQYTDSVVIANATHLDNLKLDKSDQRYNDTDWVLSQNYITGPPVWTAIVGNRTESESTLRNEIEANYTDLEIRKLDITDQRYNDTDWVLSQNYLTSYTELDPVFLTENSTLWAAINDKLDTSDQRYNETALILSVNRSSNIMALGFYNQTEIQGLIAGIDADNSTFNQSLTDTLYYSITNPSNFINLTQGQVFNDTILILDVNSTLWNHIISNTPAWLSTYNETYDSITPGNSSFNQSLADTLYYSITNPLNFINDTSASIYNDTLLILNVNSSLWQYILDNEDDWADDGIIYTHLSNFTNDLAGREFWYNHTTEAINYVDSQGYLTSYNETDPLWTANSSLILYIADLPLENQTLVHCSNITGTTSNLCTLIDTNTIGLIDTDGDYLFDNGTRVFFNSTKNNLTIDHRISLNPQGFLTSIADDSVIIKYQNISNIPSCSANQYLTFDGSVLSCETVASGTFNQTYHDTYLDVLSNRTLWFSTFNSTYDTYSYNQTQPAIDYIDSQGFITSPADWSLYPALVNVNMSENDIVSLGNINLSGKFNFFRNGDVISTISFNTISAPNSFDFSVINNNLGLSVDPSYLIWLKGNTAIPDNTRLGFGYSLPSIGTPRFSFVSNTSEYTLDLEIAPTTVFPPIQATAFRINSKMNDLDVGIWGNSFDEPFFYTDANGWFVTMGGTLSSPEPPTLSVDIGAKQVGIGTYVPEYTLDVNGNIRAVDSIRSDADQWCNATACYPLADFLTSGGGGGTRNYSQLFTTGYSGGTIGAAGFISFFGDSAPNVDFYDRAIRMPMNMTFKNLWAYKGTGAIAIQMILWVNNQSTTFGCSLSSTVPDTCENVVDEIFVEKGQLVAWQLNRSTGVAVGDVSLSWEGVTEINV